MYKKFLKLSPWKKAALFLTIAGVIFVIWFFYEIITDEPPHFFPLNDAQAQYTITKNCPQGQGPMETIQPEAYAYCLEYRGDNVLWKESWGNTRFFGITVGNSTIDLEPYVGKNVTNIQGTYFSSSKQCIQNTCIDIGGPFVVVNIKKLEIAR